MNENISAFLSERIAANDFPSAVYLVAEKGEIVYHDALGNAVVTPEVIPARLDTIYDLASLTKPLVTGLLAAIAIEDRDEHELKLDSTAGEFSSYFKNCPISSISVEQLATHVSGLPAWIPLYLLAKSRASAAEVIAATEPGNAKELRVEYSDLNFFVLSLFVEGLRIDQEFGYEVIDELELVRTSFNPLTEPWTGSFQKREIGASELGNEYEKQTCIDKGYLQPPATAGGTDRSSAFRDYQIWGEVHDGNAYFMGGVAGHAGLFSTAEEVFKIALQFLPEYTTLLKPETCQLFRTNFTKGLNEDRSFAFQLASTKDSTAGTKMSPESFGHNGFTGTSLWIDPVKDRIFILLTNRTHNHPLPFVNINSVRRRFHDIAIEELDRN